MICWLHWRVPTQSSSQIMVSLQESGMQAKTWSPVKTDVERVVTMGDLKLLIRNYRHRLA